MSDRDDDPEDDLDDIDKAARIDFRDYPSSAVVVMAALGSGLAWLLYRWRGRKNAERQVASGASAEVKGPAPREIPSDDRDI